jgi:hypothetical protein
LRAQISRDLVTGMGRRAFRRHPSKTDISDNEAFIYNNAEPKGPPITEACTARVRISLICTSGN